LHTTWEIVKSKRPLMRFVTLVVLLVAACTGLLFYTQSHSVRVSAWDREITLSTRASTVGDVLQRVNVFLGPGDLVDPPQETEITDDIHIRVERARPVFIHRQGKSLPTFTAEKSVSKILSTAQIEKSPDDVVHPGLEEEITDSNIIKIVKVTYGEVSAEQEIPYSTQRREDQSLDAGLTKVYTQGIAGIIDITYEVKYEDGKEVSRREKSRTTVKDPSPLVLLVGSRQEVSRGGQSIRFHRAIEVTATAYCPCKKCCGQASSGNTSTGIRAGRGVIAVDPRVIPLGSKVYVDGYGYAVAADVGSAIKSNKIDVCFDTHQEALDWGYKKTKVYILR
jgi:uncharacterized protein YabE (DUF348 family)